MTSFLLTFCLLVAVLVLVASSPERAAHEQDVKNLIEFLKPYEYLKDTLNSPADKVFFGEELSDTVASLIEMGSDSSPALLETEVDEELDLADELDEEMEESAESGASTSLDICPPLVSELCKPCFNFHSDLTGGNCGAWKEVCTKFFCEPLCRRNLWRVTVTADGDEEFKQQVESDEVKLALEAYLLQYGCGDMMGCCTPTPGNNFMEMHAYQGQYARLGHVAKCRGLANRDKAAELCKGKVTVKVEAIENACAQYAHQEKTSIMESAFGRAKLEATNPYHGAAKQRCQKLQDKIVASAAALEAKFNEIACPCIGCGDHNECPASLSFDVLPVSYTEFEGSDLGDYILHPEKQ